MRSTLLLIRVAAAAIVGLLFFPVGAALAGDVPAPVIPSGKGEACVADTGFMRRSHMRVLTHQRDDTVREGVRGGKFSIKDCVACHAVPASDGTPVTYSDPRHFCRACHDYAAVRIDCFECHASRPQGKVQAAGGLFRTGRR